RIKLLPDNSVPALQGDAAFGGLVEPGDAIEHRGLAGAIWADQSRDGPPPRSKGKIAHREQSAKAHGQMIHAQQHRAFCRVSSRGGVVHARSCKSPAAACVPDRTVRMSRCSSIEGSRVAISPRGFQIMMSTMPRPKSSMRYCVGSKSLPKT